jgi:dihydroorotate dehydrogenase
MIYQLCRPLLFRLDPEYAHDVTLKTWATLCRGRVARKFASRRPLAPCTVMGLDFPNPVGLAAGLDKDGRYIDALAALGFGFIEVGTVTPRPQPGNQRPRMFRLTRARAIINRMGFNNHGVDQLLERVRHTRFDGVLGINIGKNADTPVERAADDYLAGLQKVYADAGYVTVNISSPNTPGLRDLQYGDALQRLLLQLKEAQARLTAEHRRYVPLAVKVAPDLHSGEIETIARALLDHENDGVIATNTTFALAGGVGLTHAAETGGLSGAPLTRQATAVVKEFHDALGGRLPIIAAGGIMNAADAQAKLAAGASLVQLYSGLIYRGPQLVREVADALKTVATR